MTSQRTEFHMHDPYQSKKNELSHMKNLRPYSVGIRNLNGNKFKNTNDHNNNFSVTQTRNETSAFFGICQPISRNPSVNK